MAPTFDFSKGIPNIVPARTLDVFNNITEDDDFTDYAGSGDEYQADEDTLSQNVENENDNKINIMDVDTTYGEINDIEEKLLSIEMENDNTLNEYNVFDVLVRNTTMNVFEKIANDFEINFDYISLKENNNVYVLHNKEKKVENIKNNFPKLNKIVENKKINTRRLFKSNILDAKACLLSYKIQFLQQVKKNEDLYYIYDLKSKNKTSRFINMCNKLYILKNKINLGNIISNNLLTFIRDMPKNDFTYLLSLF